MTRNDYFKLSLRPSLEGDGWQRTYPVNTYLTGPSVRPDLSLVGTAARPVGDPQSILSPYDCADANRARFIGLFGNPQTFTPVIDYRSMKFASPAVIRCSHMDCVLHSTFQPSRNHCGTFNQNPLLGPSVFSAATKSRYPLPTA